MRNLKTDKDKDQVNIIYLLRMIHCLSFDVYDKVDIDVLKKVEVYKQNRQSEVNSGNVEFFNSGIPKVQILKIMTMVVVYEKNPEFLFESYTYDLFLIFK